VSSGRVGLLGGLVGVLLAAACGSEDGVCPSAEPGRICTVAGTGVAGLRGDEGPAAQAELYLPMDATVGPDDRLYIVDWNNHRIRAVGPDGILRTVAGSGRLGDGPPGAAIRSAFNHPTEVVFDPLGRLVIAAWHNSRVKVVDLTNGRLDDLCGTGRRAYSGDGWPAGAADLDLPASVAFDPAGRLHIMDQANQVIRRVDGRGLIERVAGQCIVGACAPGQAPVPCPGSNKQTCLPDASCAEACAGDYAGDGGPALQARFSQSAGQAADPAGRIAFDRAGNLLVVDTQNHRIRSIDPAGVIRTVAGNGRAGYSGDGGPAEAASLNGPIDVAAAEDGTLYIADTGNSCIRAVDPGGLIKTVAGRCGLRGESRDGQKATEARLDRPYGVALDGDRSLYIADTYNHRIRVISLPGPAGVPTRKD
jgi:DNA-binding beta-propeller fold protein YncE